MDDYVAKPITPQALAVVLDTWLPKDTSSSAGNPSVTTEEKSVIADADPEIPVFDRVGMMGRLMDDEELAKAVCEGFLADIPLQIEKLRTCLEAGDAEGARRQAHTIKGASSNVGGERLRATAYEMEKKSGAGDLDGVRTLVSALEMEFKRLKDAMTP